MSTPYFHFLIPDPKSFPSGGNIYNAQLIQALQHQTSQLEWSHDPQQFKLKEKTTFLLVDSLFLDQLDLQAIVAQKILIVHHLPSLEPQSTAEKQAAIKKEKKWLAHYDGFLGTSDFTKDYLKNTLALRQSVLTVLPALSAVDPVEKKHRSRAAISVLMVGNLIPRKGILPFLQTWSQYSWPIDFHLEIIGSEALDIAYAKKCLAFWEGLAPEKKVKISFTGALAQRQVLEKYQAADALISASKMETFGMALQEAVAAGLPLFVLAGGYSEIHVQAGNGASFSSLQELVLALKHWSEETEVQEKYAQAAAQLALAKKRDWSTAASEFLTQIKIQFPMPENAFDTTWLNTRFAFDEAARNKQVDQAAMEFLKTLPKKEEPLVQLVDIGSGTGANFLHFFEALPVAQKWIFLDHDPRLLKASLQRIEQAARAKAYPVSVDEDRLELIRPAGNISIQIIAGSFEALENLVDLDQTDLVMASAFFDLFTPEKLAHFLQKIKSAQCGLLLTLNYSGMTFFPPHPLDQTSVEWYEAHMQRPQKAGASMGPDCSRQIRARLADGAVGFVEGQSVWKIGTKDRSMIQFLLGFMEEAIGELALSEKEQVAFQDWLQDRKRQKEEEELALEVSHFDFFARRL